MQNHLMLTLNVFLIAFSGSAYSHTGVHNDSWLPNMIHFATSPDHLPFIIPAIIILGLAIRGIVTVRRSS